MTSSNGSLLLKYVIVGPSGVGKSSLLTQFVEGIFEEENDCTIGVEFGAFTTEIGGQQVKLQLWDTAGQESFRSITSSYYRGAHCALLVYDVTRRDTFRYLDGWLQETRHNADENLVIVLVGNKIDLEGQRAVETKEGKAFAERNGLLFLETSAKTSENVESAFLTSAEIVFDNVQRGVQKVDQLDERVDLSKSFAANDSGGCAC